ncbi:palmitoyltransferase ZDHHC5-A-like isoform X4 [Syngnathus typhle]|uniref:palmitoyltransferase ZDHHC5-A-like isoform X4 n=1 Tax=Syngnathus typhle TaxID=161592 RepID=UPI002A6A30F2|nr:palmitoyltransferase ZDHHC5-A-like isoform X4 [Syngnathus typhle]
MPGDSHNSEGQGPDSSPLPHSVNLSRRPLRLSRYVPVSAATFFLVGSTTLFFCFTCPWISERFSVAVPIYNGIIFLFVLANFCMATFTDPGIFPRAEEDEDKDDDFRAPLYKTVEIRGIQVRMKWCSTCHFYRPPRCSHCSVCDNCVEACFSFQLLVSLVSTLFLWEGAELPMSRYLARKRSVHSVCVQPPFPRPQLTEPQLTTKILGNGLRGDLHRSKSSLDMQESQLCDAELPPSKPELRYHGITTGSTEDYDLLNKTPPTPTMYKYRPSCSPGKNHIPLTNAYASQLSRGKRDVISRDSASNSSLIQSIHQPGFCSQPSLDQRDTSDREGGVPGEERKESGESRISDYSRRSYPLFSDSVVLSGVASQSSGSMQTSACNAQVSETTTTSSSFKSLANQSPPPPHLAHNGNLSWDSLMAAKDGFDKGAPSRLNISEISSRRPCSPAEGGYISSFHSSKLRDAEMHCQSPKHHNPLLHWSATSTCSSPPEREHLLVEPQQSNRPLPFCQSFVPPPSAAQHPPHHHHQRRSHHHHHHNHHHSHHHHHHSSSAHPSCFIAPHLPQHSYPHRAYSSDIPLGLTSSSKKHPSHSPHPPPLGKSLSYSSAAAAEMQYKLIRKVSSEAGANGEVIAGGMVGGIQAPKVELDQIELLRPDRRDGTAQLD